MIPATVFLDTVWGGVVLLQLARVVLGNSLPGVSSAKENIQQILWRLDLTFSIWEHIRVF